MIPSPGRLRRRALSLTAAALSAPFAGVLLLATAASADPTMNDRRDLAVCAAWDVHITTLIEDFGRLNIVAPVDLANAASQQIRARILCASGKSKEAARVYEEIDFPSCAEIDCADAIRRE